MNANPIVDPAIGWQPGDNVWLESRSYVLRTMRPEDSLEPMQRWWADPGIMAPLRKKAGNYSRDYLLQYINKFDNVSGFLLGIFVKETGLHIGWRRLRVYDDGSSLLDIALGDKGYQRRRVQSELDHVFYDFVFNSVGVKQMMATVYGDNVASLGRTLKLGYRPAGGAPERHFGTDGKWHDGHWFVYEVLDWMKARRWVYEPAWRAEYRIAAET